MRNIQPVGISAGATHGFSLLEVLAVTGIVAVVIGTLLPAVFSSLARAHREACLGRMRQITIAAAIYRNDNEERNPPLGVQYTNDFPSSRPTPLGVWQLRNSLSSYLGGESGFNKTDACTVSGHPFGCISAPTVFYLWDPYHKGISIGTVTYGEEIHTFRTPITPIRNR